MQDCTKFYIDGEWCAPVVANTMDVINPATEQVCARISIGEQGDVNAAAEAATRAFTRYGSSSRSERIELFGAIIAEYKNRHKDIADAISEEMGAPKTLAVKAQAAAGLAHFNSALEALKGFKFEEKV